MSPLPAISTATRIAILAGMSAICLLSQAQDLSVLPYVFPSGGGRVANSRFVLDGTLGQSTVLTAPEVVDDLVSRSGFWSQIVRWINGLPQANADAVARRPGEGAHILIRQLLANDRDPDFDNLSLVDFDTVTALGGVVYRDGPWLVYEPPTAAGPQAEDSFSYRMTDGSSPVAGSVRVGPFIPSASGPPNALSIILDSGPPAAVHVRFQGIAGRRYKVQSAAAPAGPWTDRTEITASPNGQVLFSEPPNSEPRFYRLVEPDPSFHPNFATP